MALDIRAICILALAPLEPVMAQSLAQRVAAAPDGKVEFSFASRPGVCGDGKGVIGDGRHFIMMHGNNFSMSDTEDEDDDDYFRDCPCERGPVRVSLRVRGHEVDDLNTYVGPRPSTSRTGVTDLGTVDVKTDELLAEHRENGRRRYRPRRHLPRDPGRQRRRLAGAAQDRPG